MAAWLDVGPDGFDDDPAAAPCTHWDALIGTASAGEPGSTLVSTVTCADVCDPIPRAGSSGASASHPDRHYPDTVYSCRQVSGAACREYRRDRPRRDRPCVPGTGQVPGTPSHPYCCLDELR